MRTIKKTTDRKRRNTIPVLAARPGRPNRMEIFLPSHVGEPAETYANTIFDALKPLHTRPLRVLISSEYFHYSDTWLGDQIIRSGLRTPHPPGGKSRGVAFNSIIERVQEQLNHVRNLHQKRRSKEIDVELLRAEYQLAVDLIQLGNITQGRPLEPAPPRFPRTAPRSRTTATVNVTEAKRYSTILITALQEVLDYKPRPGSNQPPPPLWRDDVAYLHDIAGLLHELRQLVDAKRAARVKSSATRFAKHFDTFLGKFASSFGTTMGKGTAGLLIGTGAALLTYAGLRQPIVTELFSHLRAH